MLKDPHRVSQSPKVNSAQQFFAPYDSGGDTSSDADDRSSGGGVGDALAAGALKLVDEHAGKAVKALADRLNPQCLCLTPSFPASTRTPAETARRGLHGGLNGRGYPPTPRAPDPQPLHWRSRCMLRTGTSKYPWYCAWYSEL